MWECIQFFRQNEDGIVFYNEYFFWQFKLKNKSDVRVE